MPTRLAALCASLLLSGAVLAATPAASSSAELAEADALFAKKAYPEALQKYTKLANAGNVTAQQHLGEMYFYGEAGKIDEETAAGWFRKAAAKGNAVAVASLDLMKQRELRRKDIDYWITGYDGADVRTDEYRCPAPRFPAVSKVNEEIDRVSARMKTWQDCYNAYVDHLNKAAPLTKRIPEDVAKLMTKPEYERATAHMTQVQEQLTEDAKVGGKLVMADYTVWRNATEAYIAEHNEILKNSPPDPDEMKLRK
jgi:TPR repeat protein